MQVLWTPDSLWVLAGLQVALAVRATRGQPVQYSISARGPSWAEDANNNSMDARANAEAPAPKDLSPSPGLPGQLLA